MSIGELTVQTDRTLQANMFDMFAVVSYGRFMTMRCRFIC